MFPMHASFMMWAKKLCHIDGTLVQYERGGRLQEKKVSAAGRYTLHSPGRPDVTFRVDKGERVGFRRGREGRIEAYAGDNPPVELDRGAANGAYWQFDRKAGQ